MIETRSLTKQFINSSGSGELFTAVNGINLSIAEGEVLALLGPNGAGKTTTVRMLAAILKPSAGQAQVAGLDVVKNASQVRQRIGLLTESPGLYERMKGREYLEFYSRLYRLPPHTSRKRIKNLLERLGMAGVANMQTGAYSKGMKQKLALARAMLHDPPVLLLDEPTSAMDPHSAKLVRDSIAGLRNERHSIIICTHNLDEAERLADRIAIIRQGQIIALGTTQELKRQLLGTPLAQVRLATNIDGLLPALSQVVELESSGPDWFNYRTTSPQETNPRLLRWLYEQNTPVITLSLLPQSLESVYLSVVSPTDSPDRQENKTL